MVPGVAGNGVVFFGRSKIPGSFVISSVKRASVLPVLGLPIMVTSHCSAGLFSLPQLHSYVPIPPIFPALP